MKQNKISKLGASLLVALGLATAANAALISGSIEFTGTATLIGGTAATATGINFGAPESVNAVFGNYSPIPVTILPIQFSPPVTFTNFNFGLPGTLGANAVIPLWTLTSGGVVYSFDLNSITVNQYSGTQRLLEGNGIAKITGFTDTPGHWALSTSGTNTTITFSSATDVPDGGTTMALFGFSLLGLYGARRKFGKA